MKSTSPGKTRTTPPCEAAAGQLATDAPATERTWLTALTAKHKLATPADWKNGQDCIVVPAVSDEAAAQLFPEGVRKIKPYLRYTPQPKGQEAPVHAH